MASVTPPYFFQEFHLPISRKQPSERERALGLRQRLSLAVAVLHRPEVLILDEPTSPVPVPPPALP